MGDVYDMTFSGFGRPFSSPPIAPRCGATTLVERGSLSTGQRDRVRRFYEARVNEVSTASLGLSFRHSLCEVGVRLGSAHCSERDKQHNRGRCIQAEDEPGVLED